MRNCGPETVRAHAEKALFVGSGLAEALLDDLSRLAGEFETASSLKAAPDTGRHSQT